jgi:ribosomal protein S27AE
MKGDNIHCGRCGKPVWTDTAPTVYVERWTPDDNQGQVETLNTFCTACWNVIVGALPRSIRQHVDSMWTFSPEKK